MAYTATTVVNQRFAERISRNMGIISGIVTLSSYHATHAEITGITRFFVHTSLLTVLTSGASSGGYSLYWNPSTLAFKAFNTATLTPTGTISGNVSVVGGGIGEAIGINPDSNAGVLSKAAATTRTIPIATFLGAAPTFTGGATTAAAFSEAANAANIGTIPFVAIGLIKN